LVSYGDPASIKTRSGLTYEDLDLSSDAEFDALIIKANAFATDTVNRYCDRDFDKHTESGYKMDGSGLNTLALPGYPVITITSLKISGTLIDPSEYRVKPNPVGPGDENSGIIERKYNIWYMDWENIEIAYIFGYDPIPELVIDVTEVIAYKLLQDIKQNLDSKGVSSYSMDGFSVSFVEDRAKAGFAGSGEGSQVAGRYPDLKRLLMYRRLAVG